MNSVKKIRVLNVTFDSEIRGFEIPAFRGAIIEKVGKENILFHNHLKDDTFLYKYPLIQYKQINKKPAIVCIDYGVDEIHKFFENRNWDIKISDRWIEMKISRLDMNQFTMQVWDKLFDYSIRSWVALNQENYLKYIKLNSEDERISFLTATLKANIISFAKGIEWTVDKPIEIKIEKIKESKNVKIKGKSILAFDLNFGCNVFLPNYIGLGKSVSIGYGVVSRIKNLGQNMEQEN